MEKTKLRSLSFCSMLEDLLVIARLEKHKGTAEIRNTLDYLMKRSKITSEELTEYQLLRRI